MLCDTLQSTIRLHTHSHREFLYLLPGAIKIVPSCVYVSAQPDYIINGESPACFCLMGANFERHKHHCSRAHFWRGETLERERAQEVRNNPPLSTSWENLLFYWETRAIRQLSLWLHSSYEFGGPVTRRGSNKIVVIILLVTIAAAWLWSTSKRARLMAVWLRRIPERVYVYAWMHLNEEPWLPQCIDQAIVGISIKCICTTAFIAPSHANGFTRVWRGDLIHLVHFICGRVAHSHIAGKWDAFI